MATVTLKTIEQSDNVGMFSICFEGDAESEFEKYRLLQDKSFRSDFDKLAERDLLDFMEESDSGGMG